MMINNKNIFLILFIFLACKSYNKVELIQKEEAKIFSLFIDELAVTFPPPPPPAPRDSSTAKKINWDSISKIKVRLVVDTIMSNFKQKAVVPEEFEDYQYLADSINNLPEKSINKKFVKSGLGHDLIFGEELKDFKGKHPQMVFISRIAFNNKLDHAALYAGRTSGELAGYVNFYLLKRNNKEWKIIYKKNVEVF